MNFEKICPLNNNLQMGEIFVHSIGGANISRIAFNNLPFINDQIPDTTIVDNIITVNNLMNTFFPLTFTYYGKQYSNCNSSGSSEMKIMSTHTTTNNQTTVSLNKDNSLTLTIKTLGISALGGNLSCADKESLVAKIIIMYQLC